MARHVVAGGGIAAMRAAETLREVCPDDPITLVAEEEKPFYIRPLLADFVAGRVPEADLWTGFETTAAAKGITLMLGQRAVGLDYRAERSVLVSSGAKVAYGMLLVATGVQPRLPRLPGADLRGVTTFSTYADAVMVKSWAENAGTAVVVGGGLQAVELTRGLRLRGLEVTLVVPDDTPWFLPLFQTDQLAIEQVLQANGVQVVVLDAPAELIGEAGRVQAVRTREGKHLPAEIVGFASNQRSRTEFLSGSSIGLAEGILTDRRLRSTDERVYAAGDVAQIEVEGERRALGYGWLRASGQGEVAGRNMGGGDALAHVGDEYQAQALYGMSLVARWR